MQVELGGTNSLRLKLQKMAATVRENVDAAIQECGEELFAESQMLTPESTPDGGRLRASGYVDHGTPGSVEVGYTAPYAYYVHEMGKTVYPERAPIHWTTPGTGAKYLERPWVTNRERFIEKIKDAARKGVK